MVQVTALVMILHALFVLDMCYASDLSSCTIHKPDHGYSNKNAVLQINNCSWSDIFRSWYDENSEDVEALDASNLYEPGDSNATVITLRKRHFSEMNHLRQVNITDSRIAQIDENSFEELTRLEVVNLNCNRISNVPQLLFRGCERLQEIYLSGNLIQTLPEFVFSTNTRLSVLDLSYNYLEAINSTELFAKTKLKHLHLEGNNISTIYKNTFTELHSLEFLNISHNKMSFSAFANCEDQPSVSYPANYIWLVDMAVKTNSCVIDLSHNKILGLPLTGIQATCNTKIHNRCKLLTLLLEGNPLSCNCEGYDLIRYFQKEWPPNVMEAVHISSERTCTDAQTREQLSFTHVDIERIYCTLNTCPNCPAGCSCRLRKHTHTVLVNCTKTQLESVPSRLPVGRDVKSEFWLSYNRISSIDGIQYPYQVRVLALSYNKMRELPPNFVKFSNLKVLELHDNDLRILTSDHVKHITMLDLDRLTLGNNPWNCSDCRILSLVKYLRNSSNVISDRKNVLCSDKKLLVAELDLDMCKKMPSAYLLILMASFLSFTILAIILLLWYEMRPKIFLNFFGKSKDAEAKPYDAFVSYAHQDEEYVVSLVRNLEARKNPFKICLHSRDWTPGEFIIKQMADSVNNSRASVIVLSAAYFRSKWCHSEFRIALTQMLVRRNHKVIVIWLSDEDPSLGKLDPDVRLYFSACTYLKYDDKRFLDKLESALCKHRSEDI